MTAATVAPPRRSRTSAVLIAFIGAVMLIPAALVFAPFGALGTPAVLIGLFAFVLWLAGRLHPESEAAFGPQPMRMALITFVMAVGASYIAANLHVLPAPEARGADRAVLQLLAVVGIALLAMDGLQTVAQVDRVLKIVVGFGAVIAGIGLLQFAVNFDIVTVFDKVPLLSANRDLALVKSRVAITRVAGTAMHPIEFGVVCAMLFPIALHFARRNPRRVVGWIPVALLGLAIPASVSRSGIIALLVAMLVYGVVWSVNERMLGVSIALVALVPARFLAPGLLGTLTKLFVNFGSDASVRARTEDYAATSGTILQHLWLGRGIGTYLPPQAPILDNQFLGQLVETGVVGLLALLVVGVVAYGCARGVRRRSSDPDIRDLAQALAATVAGGFVTFATYDFFGFALGTGLFFLVLGCIGALWRLTGGTRQWIGAPQLEGSST